MNTNHAWLKKQITVSFLMKFNYTYVWSTCNRLWTDMNQGVEYLLNTKSCDYYIWSQTELVTNVLYDEHCGVRRNHLYCWLLWFLQRPKFNCEVCTVLGLFFKKWTTLATNRTLCLPLNMLTTVFEVLLEWSDFGLKVCNVWMIRFWFESLKCLNHRR